MRDPGGHDVRRASHELASRIPGPLAPFAELAYNYRWSWWSGGDDVFRDIDPYRWELCGRNPVRLLQEASARALRRAADDSVLVERVDELLISIRQELYRPPDTSVVAPERPVAFFCAEFGVHRSLPVYSGGLGVLAGDIVKQASDSGLPLVAVGLMYRKGYFQQRVDPSGQQHEYWIDTDPDRLPAARVSGDDGSPLRVPVEFRNRTVWVQVWRVDVGRVPLYLLDADRPENSLIDRWITARLYEGARDVRLAQYAVLGVGGVRALRAMGIDPSVVHLNEGHAALATLELARERISGGAGVDEAIAGVASRTVFTTHTPVPAGNETYSPSEVLDAFSGLISRVDSDPQRVLGLGRIDPPNYDEPFGMTVLGLRTSRFRNGVSRRHGFVSRDMWRRVFGTDDSDDVPIGHVTNGVHLPTWMSAPMRNLLSGYLGDGWEGRAADPRTWDAVEDIPDAELWEVRNVLRSRLIAYVRERAVGDRLARGEDTSYVEAAERSFSGDTLTIGFGRRLVAYKRLHVLAYDADRALKLFDAPIQLLIAGKAHPQDEEAKGILRTLFGLKMAPQVGERVAYLENYEIGMATQLVAGCDVWINVPRPPLEASGTSGMKVALNGGLNLSVLDGWWEEAWDGNNGWGLTSAATDDHAEQDARDADALYGLLENDVIPLFNDRDPDGVPRGWVRRVKSSLRTIGARFNAGRMLADYASSSYRPAAGGP